MKLLNYFFAIILINLGFTYSAHSIDIAKFQINQNNLLDNKLHVYDLDKPTHFNFVAQLSRKQIGSGWEDVRDCSVTLVLINEAGGIPERDISQMVYFTITDFYNQGETGTAIRMNLPGRLPNYTTLGVIKLKLEYQDPTTGDYVTSYSTTGYSITTSPGIPPFDNPSDFSAIVPVYEFYCSSCNKHALSRNPNFHTRWPGWAYNQPAFKAHWSGTNGSVPVYEHVNSNTNDHVYSTNSHPGWSGYQLNGERFYAFTTQIAGTTPVYEFWHQGLNNHFYSTDINAHLPYAGWVRNGIVFYAYPN